MSKEKFSTFKPTVQVQDGTGGEGVQL